MRHDAIVIGGSFAGLSAATYIARATRSVAVIDAGAPRNRFAEASHGFLAQDGNRPAAILDAARAQVAAYPKVTIVAGRAIQAARAGSGFSVTLQGGEVLESERLVLAYGVSDDLPAIPGIAERWGKSVLHCPYCHGFEFAGQRLAVLATMPMSAHHAMLIAQWGPTTLLLNEAVTPEQHELEELERRGVAVETARVEALEGEGTTLRGIRLVDGRTVAADAMFLGPRVRMNSDIAQQLGCAMEEGPGGPIVRTDELKMTSVQGVFAAGDIARGMHSVTFACADGVMAGVALHRSLVF
ncbi:NAD(P)/FAD-dependent oxidoreductase [Cupriavidus sp. AU9028]|uniref:NAD(P)/FAD-dependent oxidoreductase n=1 Tax=Cupriavidus sp. AU9028 TaxID=2871157 RepID=UPI001C93A892|nr:NAD(P)/FAD-dependent oxidoreductase [Cupriavidus sp. AU9028]MBY4897852.1 NAD(P)/FAD-dependent oxidoreductase [Cupriavidus sp. AU9028]